MPDKVIIERMRRRAEELFKEQENTVHQKTDRLFGWLLVVEWLAGIAVALIASPLSWSGETSEVHIHVWTAVLLGLTIVFWPIYLAINHPGKTITRHVIAVGQMLYSALLIHLTGGRIETHFHVFGSLAFLGFYRDWRVLLSATVVVASDHILRGFFFPQSVYGVAAIEPWRWVEHAWWVVFEDIFLINACRENLREMRGNALRQAEVEETRANVELLVEARTSELKESERRLNTQFAATRTLAASTSLVDAAPLLLGSLIDGLCDEVGLVYGSLWEGSQGKFQRVSDLQVCTSREQEQPLISASTMNVFESLDLVNRIKRYCTVVQLSDLAEADEIRSMLNGSGSVFKSAFIVPLLERDGVHGFMAFYTQQTIVLNESELTMLDAIGRQVGQFAVRIEERKEADKRVGEFYSIVSHELRTPLTSIRGALGLIEGGIITPDSPQLLELVTVARSSSDRLIRLINDMLDLKKIESGKVEFVKRSINATEIVKKTIESLEGFAAQNEIILKADCRGGAVNADWDKLTQVLTNLISNAIKFSPSGSRVTVMSETTSNNRIRFSIIDTGPGIAEQDKHKLFDKFQQIDSSDTRQQGGTGLGLAICKALVEQHGGEIGFDSTVGEGSTFWVEVPGAVEHKKALKSTGEMKKRSGIEVLLVEDDDELATVLSAIIKQEGYSLTRTATLGGAIDYLEQSVPNVVILDLTLPDGCGLDLIEELRSKERTMDIPVIVTTGQQFEEKFVTNAAVVDWICKPFDPKRLSNSVERAVKVPGKCKVLVVDDDDNTRTVLTAQLRAVGLECIEAQDGFEAIYLTRREHPDLIVLDVVMPDMDGFKVVEVLRQEEDCKSTPLIIYSGRDLSADERDELTLGITRHLTKSGDSQDQLSVTIDELLGRLLETANERTRV